MAKTRRSLGLKYMEQTPRTVKVVKRQTGEKPAYRRGGRKPLPPGKRISRTGKIYWETRRDRSYLPNDKLKEKEEEKEEE